MPLQWRQNEHHGALNHQPFDCLFNTVFNLTSKETQKVRVTGPLWGESTGDRWILLAKGQ